MTQEHNISLNELAERVENLTGPDRSIDWTIHLRNGLEGVGMYGDHPSYTASIDAAMTLVPDHCWVRMDEWPGGFGQARGTASVHPIRDPAVDGHCAKADTLPLALCAASLRALSALGQSRSSMGGEG